MATKRIPLAALLATAVLGGVAPAAQAGEPTGECAEPVLSTPLAGFGDMRSYFLAPGADFESADTSRWQLAGGAQVVEGGVDRADGTEAAGRSLSLPVGASATSPEFCIDLNYPTMRFFADGAAADRSRLKVEVLYPAGERRATVRDSHVDASATWELSDDVRLRPRRGGEEAGWRKVVLRFSVEDRRRGGTFRVDDVLVDPWRRG